MVTRAHTPEDSQVVQAGVEGYVLPLSDSAETKLLALPANDWPSRLPFLWLHKMMETQFSLCEVPIFLLQVVLCCPTLVEASLKAQLI